MEDRDYEELNSLIIGLIQSGSLDQHEMEEYSYLMGYYTAKLETFRGDYPRHNANEDLAELRRKTK